MHGFELHRLQLSQNLRDIPGFLEFVPNPVRDIPGFLEFVPNPGTLRKLSWKSACFNHIYMYDSPQCTNASR